MTQVADAGRAKNPAKPQDSTTSLPMVDLETAIKAVAAIREKAVETASMPEVAKALGYANATSSPFYRRMAAARLFGLLSAKSLTQRAKHYIKPQDEQMKARAVKEAVMGIPAYKVLVTRYAGKKINVELVANAIETDHKLTVSCANLCARVFESSLRFAGMLSADGSVEVGLDSTPPETQQAQLTPPSSASEATSVLEPRINGPDTQQHTLLLDKGKVRTFSFNGPVEVTLAEYERICQWLKVTMIVADSPKGESQ